MKNNIIAAALCLFASICVFFYISVIGNNVDEGGINPLSGAGKGMGDNALPSNDANTPESITPISSHPLQTMNSLEKGTTDNPGTSHPDIKEVCRPESTFLLRGTIPDSIWAAFNESVENSYTTAIFKELQHRFKDSSDDLQVHYQSVNDYLHTQVDLETAEKVMDLYRRFTEYEIRLVEKVPAWNQSAVTGSVGAIDLLDAIYRDKVFFFGEKTADALFGEEYRWQIYDLKKNEIMKDEFAGGREKEDRIRSLQTTIWGEGVNVSEMKTPLERYEEKCQLYKKDLDQKNDMEKAETLRQFRHETLPPEAARRMDERIDFSKIN